MINYNLFERFRIFMSKYFGLNTYELYLINKKIDKIINVNKRGYVNKGGFSNLDNESAKKGRF